MRTISRHTPVGQAKMDELVSVDLEEVIELPSTGVHFFQTNLVTKTSNYKGVTGLTALRTYIFGKDGIFSINLGAQNDTTFGDGDWRNISIALILLSRRLFLAPPKFLSSPQNHPIPPNPLTPKQIYLWKTCLTYPMP